MFDQDAAPPRELTQRGTKDQAARPLPRPDAEKPYAAETAINRALGADTTPGSIGRSDDAPHIWAEIKQLSIQFGRLEKQVEITSNTVEGHRTTLQTVSVNTETLCIKHDQFKRDVDTISVNINNTLNGLISGAESRFNGKLDTLGNEVKGIAANGQAAKSILDTLAANQAAISTQVNALNQNFATANATLQTLNTTQAATLQTIKVLSPFVKWGISGIAAFVVAGFGLGTWIWNSTIEPKLIEESAKKAQSLVEESIKNKALQAENEKLKAENEALRKDKKPK